MKSVERLICIVCVCNIMLDLTGALFISLYVYFEISLSTREVGLSFTPGYTQGAM